jgi:glutaredoxin
MVDKALIMYSRVAPCPDCSRAKHLLDQLDIPYQEKLIDRDPAARALVVGLTGHQSVPTLVIARPGETSPYPEPKPLEKGRSPRGVDRGTVLTEPDMITLRQWLANHGFTSS